MWMCAAVAVMPVVCTFPVTFLLLSTAIVLSPVARVVSTAGTSWLPLSSSPPAAGARAAMVRPDWSDAARSDFCEQPATTSKAAAATADHRVTLAALVMLDLSSSLVGSLRTLAPDGCQGSRAVHVPACRQ